MEIKIEEIKLCRTGRAEGAENSIKVSMKQSFLLNLHLKLFLIFQQS